MGLVLTPLRRDFGLCWVLRSHSKGGSPCKTYYYRYLVRIRWLMAKTPGSLFQRLGFGNRGLGDLGSGLTLNG